MEGGEQTVVRSATHARIANDWMLVLTAAGIPCDVQRSEREWHVVVAAAEVERAAAALAAYDAESVAPVRRTPAGRAEYGRSWGGLVMIALLLLAARRVGMGDAPTRLFQAGTAQADRIVREGELWRTVTALTLHGDWTHLASNLAAGAVVATTVCWAVGPGVAAWLLLLAGAAGNLVTALLYESLHRSVGASTAIFGGIGILVGLAVVQRWRRAWVPVAAGLALLGLLGTSERADLIAHAFGFLAGVPLGLGMAFAPIVRSPATQAALGVAAMAVVVACWWLAGAALGSR